jgi:HSP20 family protein
MFLTRWQPLHELHLEMDRLHREMDRLFNRFGDGWSFSPVYPAMNVWQDENNVFVEAEVPGFELSDLEIYVTGGNQLTVRGERKKPELQGGSWHRQERPIGQFSRVITLPLPVDPDNVEAHLSLGVLTIRLPKRAEVKPRRIEVKCN